MKKIEKKHTNTLLNKIEKSEKSHKRNKIKIEISKNKKKESI